MTHFVSLLIVLVSAAHATSPSSAVHVGDVGFSGLDGIRGRVDSGTVVVPKALVTNYGNHTADVGLILRVAPDYCERESILIDPGMSLIVPFALWTAVRRGTHIWSCSLTCGGLVLVDKDSLQVRVADAGVDSIIWPTGNEVERGLNVPKVVIRNFGNLAETIAVDCKIHYSQPETLLYRDSTLVYIPAGQMARVDFRPWDASVTGQHYGVASTSLAGDKNSSNDSTRWNFTIVEESIDYGILGIETPDSLVQGRYNPSVLFKCWGRSCDLTAALELLLGDSLRVYVDTQRTRLTSGLTVNVTFATWQADPGRYLANLVTYVDSHLDYDTSQWHITVFASGISEDEQVDPLPAVRSPMATVIHGMLNLSLAAHRLPLTALLDVEGREVLSLKPGPNDVSRIAPGVYFIREQPSAVSRQPVIVRKIVLTR